MNTDGTDAAAHARQTTKTGSERQLALARLLRSRLSHGPMSMPVSGESMGRAITGGGRVRLAARDRYPRRGEIWAYADVDGAFVVHRFRSCDGDLCWFRGDGNPRDDPPVPVDALIGLVIAMDDGCRERRVGRIDRLAGRLRMDLLSLRHRVRRMLVLLFGRW